MSATSASDGQVLESSAAEPLAPSALDGIRVLDLAGPMGVYCGKLLADLGADVIRVEPPQGDASRRIPPFYEDRPGLERSLFHWHFNANKRGITLDLTTRDGQAVFRQLASRADVVVETFSPGYLAGLGLGYDQLSALNPRLVLTSVTPFGQDGPYAQYQGGELLGQAAGGLLWVCGWPDRPPVMMGGWPALYQASAQAAIGTLLALDWREQSGTGQHVDASVQGALPLSLMASMAEFHATGRQRSRQGDGHPGPLNGLFRCADGYADFRFRGRPGRWERVVEWLASKGAAGDLGEPQWRDAEFRRRPENQQHIDEVFQRFVAGLSREEAMDVGQRVGFEVGAVYTAEEVVKEAQLEARRFFVELEHPELGRAFLYPGAPYRHQETPWRLRRRAPLLGEHNLEVYEGELGLSREQVITLYSAGVI